MPTPVSRTEKSYTASCPSSPQACTLSCRRPPGGVNFTEFPSRFKSTWRRRIGSPVSQSLSIMTYFISWVVAGGILRALLNYDGGAINNLLVSIGFERLDFYNDPKYWRVILTLCNIWKSAGYNGIIYFSTIAGFDTSLYESAQVDGANLWQRICYITIPLLKPTIIILFLLSIGKIMSGDLTMMMSITNLSPMLLDTTDIIDTYVYRSVIGVGDFVMGSAVGLYQSIFGFILVLFSNWLVGRFDKDYQLF